MSISDNEEELETTRGRRLHSYNTRAVSSAIAAQGIERISNGQITIAGGIASLQAIWFRIWGKLPSAEQVGEYAKAGSQVLRGSGEGYAAYEAYNFYQTNKDLIQGLMGVAGGFFIYNLVKNPRGRSKRKRG